MAQTIGWPALAALALGYLLGSIPFGLLLTRLAGTADIRAIGSRSIGATNVLRTGRTGLAAATLVCDVLKGTAAVALAAWLFGRDPALPAGLGAFLGHLFPVWLHFKGGKGVATYIGILIGMAAIGASWIPLALFLALWLAVAAVTRYSSLAGLIACAATPVVLWATGDRREAGLFLLLTLLVFIMHRANIARLIQGRESKIGTKAPMVPESLLTTIGPIRRGDDILDIIFIHGLGGDGQKTWAYNGGDNPSLLHWLGEDLSEVQIWTLKWPAHVFSWIAVNGEMPVQDRARNILALLRNKALGHRPLLFITHSLGGVLVKQMLHDAVTLQDREWHRIAQNTMGLIFIATPHTGAALANVATALARAGSSVLIRQLNKSDPHLRGLTDWYSANATRLNYRTLALYETQLTHGIRVVDEVSANPQAPDCIPIPVDANHFTIAKPKSKDSTVYEALLSFTRKQILRPIELPETPPDRKILAFTTSYLGTSAAPVPFGGRDDDLAFLNNWLYLESSGRLLLTSPAGRGKSALLVRWLQTVRQRRIPNWHAVFVPISVRFGTNVPAVFYRLLATQLSTMLHRDLQHPSGDAKEYYANQAASLISDLITAGHQLLVVIDGVDEALNQEFDTSIFPPELPLNTRILMSARFQVGDVDSAGWRSRLNWDSPITVTTKELMPLDGRGLLQVLRSLQAPVDDLELGVADRLLYLTDGEPLLIRLYAEELWQKPLDLVDRDIKDTVGRITIRELDSLKPGFGPYFRYWIGRELRVSGDTLSKVDLATVNGTLAILACAYGPMDRDSLVLLARNIHGIPDSLSATHLLEPLRRFVFGTGAADGGYTLSHPKFGQYLREEYLTDSTVERTKRGIAEWGRAIVKDLNQEGITPDHVPAYLLQFHSKHLEDVDAPWRDFVAMLSDGWRRALEKYEGGYRGFAATALTALRRLGPTRSYAPHYAAPLENRILASLCLSSIQSIGTNTPFELLDLALDEGLMTLKQAIHRIELQLPENQSQGLATIARHLDSTQLEEAIRAALRTSEPTNRAAFLVLIATRISGDRQLSLALTALDEIQRLSDPYQRVRLTADLFSSLDEKTGLNAIEDARLLVIHIDNNQYKAIALGKLAACLSKTDNQAVLSLIPPLVEALDSVQAPLDKAAAILELSGRLPQLDLERQTSELLPALDAMFNGSLIAHRSQARGFDSIFRLSVAYRTYFSLFLLSVQNKPQEAREQALSIVQRMLSVIDEMYHRVDALIHLAPFVWPEARPAFIEICFDKAKGLPSGNNRTHAMLELARHASGDQKRRIVSESLQNTTFIDDESIKTYSLTSFISQLPENSRGEELTLALQSMASIKYATHRIAALVGLADIMPPIQKNMFLDSALQLAEMITDRLYRVNELSRLLPKLPPERRRQIFQRVFDDIKSMPADHSMDIMVLAGTSSDTWENEHLDYAVQVLNRTAEAFRRGALFSALLPIASRLGRQNIVDEAIRTAFSAGNPAERGSQLARSASFVPDDRRREIVDAALIEARSIIPPADRCRTLLQIAPHLGGDKLDTVIEDIIRTIVHVPSNQKWSFFLGTATYRTGEERTALIRAAFGAARGLVPAEKFAAVLQLVPEMPTLEERLDAIDLLTESSLSAHRSTVLSSLGTLAPLLAAVGHEPLVRSIVRVIVRTAEWWP